MPQPAWVTGRLQQESFLSRFFYNTILKRSSTYMTAVMVVATATGMLGVQNRSICRLATSSDFHCATP